MTEEVKTEVKQEVKEEVKSEVQTELSNPFEVRASEQGWQPLEAWTAAGNDAADWRDARAFLDRGEILSRVSQQSKEIKELRKTLRAFEDQNKKLSEKNYVEEIARIRTAKKNALEAGDAGRVVELDEQLDMVRDAQAQSKAQVVTPDAVGEAHPEFQSWVDKNSWYATNDEMRMFADNVGTSFAKLNRDKSPKEVLKYVEQRVRRAYSEMFENGRRQSPNKVEGGTQTRTTTAKTDTTELPAEAQSVMRTLVKSGVMTEAEYIKQYKQKA